MERSVRLQRLSELFRQSSEPVTGADLAQRLGVTRQVVVHDIALLRAQGVPILSTPRGYWMHAVEPGLTQRVLAVQHTPELTATELYILVDHGIHVLDVVVEHPLYGELRGSLHLASRRDVDQFLAQFKRTSAPLLSTLTDGMHLHTIAAPNEARLAEAVTMLRENQIQVFD
ncbi:MAG: transcription repressor NadR [Alicyclobacillus sp.]|nr:transcription repressor NadR [Alicyclobacillus sp.]